MLKLLAVALTTTTAAAQITTYQGLDFVHVGNAGNRQPWPSETRGLNSWTTWGSVGYEYGIMEAEVTMEQFAEFMTAYGPHHRPIPNETLSGSLDLLSVNSQGVFTPFPGTERFAVKTKWIMAARYANWIHNGKSSDPEAFFDGAYDLSPDRFTEWFTTVLSDIERQPGALVALPTADEWAKAAYYDPNRYGPGEGGYWKEPAGTDFVLQTGRPGEPNAETSRGLLAFDTTFDGGLPVLSYPDIRSSYGVADLSGTWREALESSPISSLGFFAVAGSDLTGIYGDSIDAAAYNASALQIEVGIRLVRIPAPSTVAFTTLALAFTTRRRPHH